MVLQCVWQPSAAGAALRARSPLRVADCTDWYSSCMPASLPRLLMLGAAICWGVSTVTTKVALEQFSPAQVLGIELIVGAAAVWAVLLRRGRLRVGPWWRAAAVLGLLEPGLTFALFDFGLDQTGAIDGALLLAAETPFSVLGAWALLGERATPPVLTAVAVGFGGAAILGSGASGAHGMLMGDLLVLGASATAAGYGVAARRLAGGAQLDALAVTAVQLLAAAVAVVPLVTAAEIGHGHGLPTADAEHVGAVIGTGLLGGALPFLLFNRAIRDLSATGAALVTNLVPALAALSAFALLGDRPGSPQIAGGALMVIAALGSAALPSPR